MEHAQRFCDHRRRHDLLDRELAGELSLLVLGSVAMVLHRDPGEVLFGRAVGVHVGAGDHRVEAREGDAVVNLELLIGGCRQHVRNVRPVGHLLDARCQDQVARARGHIDERLPQRHAARGAGRLDVDRGDAGHAELIGHQRTQVLLARELAARHAAHIHRVDAVSSGIVQRCGRRFHEHLAQALVPELAESRHAGSNDRNLTHVLVSCRQL